MGNFINGYIMPHPPVMIPEIGKSRTRDIEQTIQSANAIADQIAIDNPDTIIISSPHAPCYKDMFYLAGQKILYGNFANFGHPEIEITLENNLQLAESIVSHAVNEGLPAKIFETQPNAKQLDHGALVPLYFITSRLPRVKLVLLSTPFMSLPNLFRFGQCIGQAVEASTNRVVYLASGDLSHGLTSDAPAGLCPTGSEYDHNLIEMIRTRDLDQLLSLSEDEMEHAAECGTRSFVMMFGALDKFELKSKIYSYEGPFGVGYLNAKTEIIQSAQVRLARESIEEWIKNQSTLSIPDWLPKDLLKTKAGCFVSLKKQGSLRGCIGTISAVRDSLAEEIIQNAKQAASEDPRFPPVTAAELSALEISVDVLGPSERISSFEQLDVKRYGVIVSAGWRRGLLLPDLDGVDSPQQQVTIALQKAGIDSQESYELERFEVIRYY